MGKASKGDVVVFYFPNYHDLLLDIIKISGHQQRWPTQAPSRGHPHTPQLCWWSLIFH
jgi:hypothetical protein